MKIHGLNLFLGLSLVLFLSACARKEPGKSVSAAPESAHGRQVAKRVASAPLPETVSDTVEAGFPHEVALVHRAIATADAALLSKHVRYPLRMPYPLKDITGGRAMRRDFHLLFDSALIQKVRQSRLSAWEEVGWRGRMFDRGILWADEDGLTAVNHLSAEGEKVFSEAVRRDLSSLHPSLQGQKWTPFRCLRTVGEGSVYRVDERYNDGNEEFRLCVYPKKSAANALPIKILMGRMEVEGTMRLKSFEFTNGQDTVSFSDSPIDGGYTITLKTDGTETSRRFKFCYWQDVML